jgi:hypothetical protein
MKMKMMKTIGVIVAIGIGIMMSVSSGKPTLTQEADKP